MLTSERPDVKDTSRYTQAELCTRYKRGEKSERVEGILGIDRQTFRVYCKRLGITGHYNKNTNRTTYSGKEVMKIWLSLT